MSAKRFLPGGLGLAVLLATLLAAPGAEARHGVHQERRHAWHVVRHDPCLWHQFTHFAARHKNPNKRDRFVMRLAYEGCRDRDYCPDHGPYPYRGHRGYRSHDDDSSDARHRHRYRYRYDDDSSD